MAATRWWVENEFLPVEYVDEVIARYDAELEPTDRLIWRQGYAWLQETLRKAKARIPTPRPPTEAILETKARVHHSYRCELCGNPPRYRGDRLQVEHMLSKYEARALGLPEVMVHARSNLANACFPCNKRKGTRSLRPDQIKWVWGYHGFGGSQMARHLILCFANVLHEFAWDVLPLQAQIEAEMGRAPGPVPTIGTYVLQDPKMQEIIDHFERGRAEVRQHQAKSGAYWTGESASDDNREMWGRASWQR